MTALPGGARPALPIWSEVDGLVDSCRYYDPEAERGWHHPHRHEGGPCPYFRVGLLLAGHPDPADDVAEWRIDLDGVLDARGRVPLTLNSRLHWAATASAVKRIKAITRNAVLAADVPHLAHVHVELHYRPKTNQYRDPDNLVATMKPAIDALHHVDPEPNSPVPFSPIVDGDDPRYVTWSPPTIHPWEKGSPPSLWLILRSYE